MTTGYSWNQKTLERKSYIRLFSIKQLRQNNYYNGLRD